MLILNNYRAMFIITFLLATLCLNSKPYEKYETMLTDFKNLSVDSSKVYSISNFSIKRNPSEINIDTGTIYFCKPINGRYRFFIFDGKVKFKFTPKKLLEINQLKRLMKKDSIDVSAQQMLIFFSDDLEETIESKGKLIPYHPNYKFKPKEIFKDFLEYEFDSKQGYNNNIITSSVLNDRYDESFYVFLKRENKEDLFFQINPNSSEEIEFSRGDWNAFHSFNEIICKYHLDNKTDNEEINYHKNDTTKIRRYDIEASLNNNFYLKATTKIELNGIDTTRKWILFNLLGNLNVTKVIMEDSIPLKYYQSSNNLDLWIKLPEKIKSINPLKMKFVYEGDVFINGGIWFNSIFWYPSFGDQLQKAIFNLTFTTPKKYEFVTVGDLIDKVEVGNNIKSHWISSHPIRNASFSIDEYKKKELKTKDSVNLLMLYKNENFMNNFMLDLPNIIEKFDDLFGRIKINKFISSEELGHQFEAFPGLIHLSNLSYYYYRNEGYCELLCAHEVAHQWWGIGVDFESYHDQWLSEGLAQYSALIYLQCKFKNNLLFEYIKNYEKSIIDVRNNFLGKPIPAGPISLGFRNSTTKTRGDYGVVVYNKGALVFHMIRNLLLNLQTMKEDKFFNMMKEFYQENVGKTVNTNTFKKKVEIALNMDMDWFFNQWVYDYKIPKYKFAYHVNKNPAGSYQISCRVEQSEVDPNFQMYVPIKIDFGDKKVYRIRKLITGSKTEFDLPLFADKPIEVIFNDLESVLCEVDNVKW